RAPARRAAGRRDAPHGRRRPVARSRARAGACRASGRRARAAPGRSASLLAPPGGRMTPVRVVLVEDNDTFRETLELLFGSRDEIELIGSAASGDDAPALCAKVCPDVVLMDYRMPG